MSDRRVRGVLGIVLGCILLAGTAPAADPVSEPDPHLKAAARFVKQSDRYMHHSKLTRGMKGYGLTVMAGTEPQKFSAEIVSVVEDWTPHQAVILARLKGLNLERSMIISGMSGSPVYMTDPADGKTKLIGAVAYGWQFQNDPICGIQPITNMFALQGALPEKFAPKLPDADTTGKKTSGNAGQARLPESLRKALLNPKKRDFASLLVEHRARARSQSVPEGLSRLSIPLNLSGMHDKTFAQADKHLRKLGFLPVRGGKVNAATRAGAMKDAEIVPGGGVSIPLAMGDVDYAAVGTVTDVYDGGKRWLAFGHSFFAEGDVSLASGPAYIHTIISSQVSSFKLGGTARLTGKLGRDENTAIAGTEGIDVPMIPMGVSVTFVDDRGQQKTAFKLCREWYFTSVLPRWMVLDSVWNFRSLPQEYTVSYTVKVDYGKLGTYESENITSSYGISDATSDLERVVSAMVFNEFGQRVFPESIDVSIRIEKGDRSMYITRLDLDGKTYKPGETVRGKITVQRYRKPRTTVPVAFKIPDDLAEGTYRLTATDADEAAYQYYRTNPHLFDPETTEELFAAVQRTVTGRYDKLYLTVDEPRVTGTALKEQELPELPASRLSLLAEAKPRRTYRYAKPIVQTQSGEGNVFVGAASASFTVSKKPGQIRLHD